MGKTDIKRDILFAPNGCYFPDAYCRGYHTHTHSAFVCVHTVHCVCCDHYRTRAYGGQEQWSNSRTLRTGASVWTRTPTYQHAHAHLRSRARGAGNKWEYVAESTVLTCSVSQGGVGKTLILTKLQGRGGGEIIDNQQVTERGEVQLPVWRGLPAHSEAAKIFLYFT